MFQFHYSASRSIGLSAGLTTRLTTARFLVTALVMACTVLVMLALTTEADETGSVSITLSSEAVGISITGGAINFGGPHAPGAVLLAHPSGSAQAAPPSVVNSGNLPIAFLSVAYDGPTGQEASCDNGDGSWAAHGSSAAQDRFFMRALASTSTSTSTFNSSALAITPATGSADLLATTLAVDGTIPLLLQLFMPNPPVAGGEGCSISLTVTAAAE